ncbi:MAG TPA: ArsC/Spx/MgsR family protein [Mycobacteriales bacterium]|nr:ArsC/Spx/MgsR family protein [Mycobacteriales bacterium]
MEIWFNPKCSKCRMAKEALDAAGVDYTIRRYLEEPPSADELRKVLDQLGLEPWDITRTSDPLAEEAGVAGWPRDRDDWLSRLAANPALIQRPILVTPDGEAWVARDPETVKTAVEHALPATSG